jgi:hypothetical protein
VLVQSAPLHIVDTLKELESQRKTGLLEIFHQINSFAQERDIRKYSSFKEQAGEEWLQKLEMVCSNLQNVLKVQGDWKIYPFGVHDLIAKGRVAVDGRAMYVDGKLLPEYGYRLG